MKAHIALAEGILWPPMRELAIDTVRKPHHVGVLLQHQEVAQELLIAENKTQQLQEAGRYQEPLVMFQVAPVRMLQEEE